MSPASFVVSIGCPHPCRYSGELKRNFKRRRRARAFWNCWLERNVRSVCRRRRRVSKTCIWEGKWASVDRRITWPDGSGLSPWRRPQMPDIAHGCVAFGYVYAAMAGNLCERAARRAVMVGCTSTASFYSAGAAPTMARGPF